MNDQQSVSHPITPVLLLGAFDSIFFVLFHVTHFGGPFRTQNPQKYQKWSVRKVFTLLGHFTFLKSKSTVDPQKQTRTDFSGHAIESLNQCASFLNIFLYIFDSYIYTYIYIYISLYEIRNMKYVIRNTLYEIRYTKYVIRNKLYDIRYTIYEMF